MMAVADGTLSPRQRGCRRDSAIVAEIERRHALTTDQVSALFFRNMAQSQRKAQERLLKLHARGRLKRCRVSTAEPYFYYTGRRHGRLEHLLGVNWVYVSFTAGLRPWELIHCFDYEVNFKILQADAICGIRNTVTGRCRFWFVEMDRSDTNEFDKVRLYNRLYASEGYAGQVWVDLADRFPVVLVITETSKRAARIQDHIRKENTHDLEFDVRLLDDLRRGLPWR